MLNRKTALLFTLTVFGSFCSLNATAQNNTSSQSVNNQAKTGASASSTAGARTVINPGNYTPNVAALTAAGKIGSITSATTGSLKAALAAMTPAQRAAFLAALNAKKAAKAAAKRAANRVGNPFGPYDPDHYQPNWAIMIDNQMIPMGIGLPPTGLGGDSMGGS